MGRGVDDETGMYTDSTLCSDSASLSVERADGKGSGGSDRFCDDLDRCSERFLQEKLRSSSGQNVLNMLPAIKNTKVCSQKDVRYCVC